MPPLDGPPTPDSVDGGSEASWRPASSSPCSLTEAPGVGLGLGLALGLGPSVLVGSGSWREQAETEASLKRLLPTLDALLQQLDRVTAAAEDLYYTESRLEQERQARRQREVGDQGGGEEEAVWKEQRNKRGGKEAKQKGSRKAKKKEPAKDSGKNAAHLRKTLAAAISRSRPVQPGPAHTPGSQSAASVHPPSSPEEPQTPVSQSSAVLEAPPTPCTPVPGPSHSSTPPPPPITCDWNPPPPPPSSSLFNHPAHTTTIPTRKRKRKPPPLKNKVHPNLDHHGKS